MVKKKLGEILLERGLIDVEQLNAALAHQRQWGMRLGTVLVAKGFIAEGMLTRVLAESLGIPMVDLAKVAADHKALQLVPRRLAEQYDVFPIALKEQPNGRRLLLLAMADPLNATAIDEVAFSTDTIVKPAIAQISSLEQAIRRHYYGQRIDVAPLAMHRGSLLPGPVDEPMTIVSGTGEERVVDHSGPVAVAPVPSPAEAAPSPSSGPRPAPPVEYAGMPAGVFTMARAADLPLGGPEHEVSPLDLLEVKPLTRPAEQEDVEALEKKFWALMRVLARRGLVTKEEFLAELRSSDS